MASVPPPQWEALPSPNGGPIQEQPLRDAVCRSQLEVIEALQAPYITANGDAWATKAATGPKITDDAFAPALLDNTHGTFTNKDGSSSKVSVVTFVAFALATSTPDDAKRINLLRLLALNHKRFHQRSADNKVIPNPNPIFGMSLFQLMQALTPTVERLGGMVVSPVPRPVELQHLPPRDAMFLSNMLVVKPRTSEIVQALSRKWIDKVAKLETEGLVLTSTLMLLGANGKTQRTVRCSPSTIPADAAPIPGAYMSPTTTALPPPSSGATTPLLAPASMEQGHVDPLLLAAGTLPYQSQQQPHEKLYENGSIDYGSIDYGSIAYGHQGLHMGFYQTDDPSFDENKLLEDEDDISGLAACVWNSGTVPWPLPLPLPAASQVMEADSFSNFAT